MKNKRFLTRYTAEKLPGESLDVLTWEGSEVVLFEEVVDAHAQEFRHQADVVAMVEPRK